MNLFTDLSLADGAALLLAVAAKGTLVFLLAFLAVAMLRRVSAATRHAVWAFAFGTALMLPLLFAVVPGWHVPVLPAQSLPAAAFPAPPVAPAPPAAPMPRMAPAPAVAPRAPKAPRAAVAPPVVRLERDVKTRVLSGDTRAFVIEHRAAAPAAVSPMPWSSTSMPGPMRDWKTWLVLVWGAGAFLIAARWFLAVLGAWRLVQQAEPVYDLDWLDLKERVAFGMELHRPVRLLRSDRLTIPIAGGVFDPVVVLPYDADDWDEDRREVVLTHELAHIVRRDCLTQSVAQGSLALHWFNPLAWLAYRRFMVEREHACDDFVLNHGARASDYAQHLVQIARRFRREPLALAATAPMARRSNLEGRVLSILDPAQNRGAATRTDLATVGVLALALAAPLAAFQPVESQPETPKVWESSVAKPSPPQPAIVSGYAFRSSDDTFLWEGRVGRGGFIEVHGVNGSIRARTGSGDRVKVEAEKKSRRGMEDEVEIVVNEFANGVVVCAVYPGQRAECEPGQGARGNVRDNDVQVTFDIVLPEDVRFVGRTVNGSVKTDDLGGDVEARTVNGSIETASRRGDVTASTVNGSITAEAAGLVRANTTNGSIRARLGRAEWDGEMTFETTNGSIVLDLPASLDANVRARAQTGSIHSDFPLNIQRTGHVGSQAEGRIGSGGRQLDLRVLNGSIKLRRTSGAFGTVIDRKATRDAEREVEREARRNIRVEEPDFAAIERALEGIGPIMEQAMAEAGRAMAAIDFEGEIALAMDEVDWQSIQAEVDQALAEATVEMEAAHIEAWSEAEADLDEALEDLRSDLDEVNAELDDVEQDSSDWTESERRALRSDLRAARAALQNVERELERVRCEARAQRDGNDARCREQR
ncbi:MAG: M56 family metallopeptidase [Rhodothermales bacterium]